MSDARMINIDYQESLERHYCRKHINTRIDRAIRETPEVEAKVHEGVVLLQQWLQGEYHESKMKRLQRVAVMDLEQLVRDVYIITCYCVHQELFVTVTSQLASKIGFDDRRESIQTIAEIVAVLCQTDVYDLIKESRQASLMVQTRLQLPRDLVHSIERSLHVLPMVSKPAPIRSNFESPYLTFNEGVVLGKGNNHGGDLCLDVINIQNQTALKLNPEFLNQVEEQPNPDHELDTPEKLRNWKQFKKESHEVYRTLIRAGNEFWLNHKPDKRGRLYAQGYHVTTQGSAFKKAMLELHHEEIVDGTPSV